MAQPGTVLAGKYRVERLLGEGGMGMVVAARELDTQVLVALKFMLPQALSFHQAAYRFAREGQVLAGLHSENLPMVTDIGVLDNSAPYFAMEYIDGVDLSKLVRQYGPLATCDAADFLIQACHGMAAVHRHDLVHRDLKPSNILVTLRSDGTPLVKVLDFGLIKVLSAEEEEEPTIHQTQTAGTMGTPAYMSPEQARSAKNVDQRSDIWSLGAILYYLLSAKLPFQAQDTAEAFAKLLYDSPKPLREEAPWVPEELEDVVMRCLQKDPDHRYQTVDALIEVLRRFSSDGDFEDRSLIIVEGPPPLDIAMVLQQRTAIISLDDAVPLGLAGTLADAHGALPAAAEHRHKRRKSAVLMALGGMALVAAVIGGVAFYKGRGSSSAATQPRSETSSLAAPAAASRPAVEESTPTAALARLPDAGAKAVAAKEGEKAAAKEGEKAAAKEGEKSETAEDKAEESSTARKESSSRKRDRKSTSRRRSSDKKRDKKTKPGDPFGIMD